MLHALRSQWAPIFAHREVCPQAMSEIFSHAPPNAWDWSSIRLPTEQTILKIILASSDSGTGPDGIPNSAWTPRAFLGQLSYIT